MSLSVSNIWYNSAPNSIPKSVLNSIVSLLRQTEFVQSRRSLKSVHYYANYSYLISARKKLIKASLPISFVALGGGG